VGRWVPAVCLCLCLFSTLHVCLSFSLSLTHTHTLTHSLSHYYHRYCGSNLPVGVADRLYKLFFEGATIETSQKINSIGATQTRRYSYSDFVAWQSVVTKLPGIVNVFKAAIEAKRKLLEDDGDGLDSDSLELMDQLYLSKDDFKMACKVFHNALFSRQEVDAVYSLFDLNNDGRVSLKSVESVLTAGVYANMTEIPVYIGREKQLTMAPPPGTTFAGLSVPAQVGQKTKAKWSRPVAVRSSSSSACRSLSLSSSHTHTITH
jgi:hypothetical protein